VGHHLCFRLLEQAQQLLLTDDVEFHLLELPKFTKAEAELASGLDKWLYFLRYAEKIDTEAVPAALQEPLILRALEELKMLTQSELERQIYEDRRKAQLDHASWVDWSNRQREEGEKVGAIHLCEQLLNLPETPTEELAALSLGELTRLADELREQVIKSRGAG
jgi:predicted transposase/invertase (TIGR01784 family)